MLTITIYSKRASVIYSVSMSFTRRIGALRRRLTRTGASGVIVTHLPDLRYLTGFTGSSAALAVTRHAVRLFTDGRYAIQAADEVKNADLSIITGALSSAAVQWMAAQVGVDSIAFDPTRTTVAELDRWKAALPSRLRRRLLVPSTESLMEPLRGLKDIDELAILSEAARVGCRLFDHILGLIRPGMREIEVAAELEYKARCLGAEGMSFETIVASGVRSALPHGLASSARLPRKGFVTLDFGVILKGYCSDMTRTIHLGQPGNRERSIYQSVLDAEQAGIDAVISGAVCEDVDEAARDVLRQARIGDAFTHSTGHGVGLEIHEWPRVGSGQKTRLAPGMVITIEPGVYFAGEFGVRIEDMVAVTRTGGQVLTPAPRALIEL